MALSNLFVGSTILDIPLKGNPWKWENNAWNLMDQFDISTDFPTIDVLQEHMSSVILNLCFRHKNQKDYENESKEIKNIENNSMRAQNHNNQSNKNDIYNYNEECDNDPDALYDNTFNPSQEYQSQYSKNNINNRCDEQQIDVRNLEGHAINRNNTQIVDKKYFFQELKRVLPETPTNILISEVLKIIAMNLKVYLTEGNSNFKNSDTYLVNKSTLRKLLSMLSCEDGVHFKLLCTSLLPLLVADDNLVAQVSQINDVVRLIRHHPITPYKSIMYIKVNNLDFDNSQASIIIRSVRSAD